MKRQENKKDGALILLTVAAILFFAFKPAPKRKGSLIIGEPYDGEWLPDATPKIVDTLQPATDQTTDVVPVRIVTDSGGNITAYDAAGSVYTPIAQPYAGGGSSPVYANDGGGGADGGKIDYIGPFTVTYDQQQNMISGLGNAKRGNLGAVKII